MNAVHRAKPPEQSTGPAQSPEHVVVLLLEGCQRFLNKAEDAIRQEDSTTCRHYLKRADSILHELDRRLNLEQGGKLAANLARLYDWWVREIRAVGAGADVERLRQVSTQMGEIRQAWEYVLFRGEGMSEGPVA